MWTVILLITAIMLKPLHSIFAGENLCWYVLLFNRNSIIALIVLGLYLREKIYYGRYEQFHKGLSEKYIPLHNRFLKTAKYSLGSLKIYCYFWIISAIFCNIDILLSYHGLLKDRLTSMILAEYTPYVFLLFVMFKKTLDWIRGKDVRS